MTILNSYNLQSQLEERLSDKRKLPSCFADPSSVDAWRHKRMHEMLLPLVETDPSATWMTVGDGNFGSDAYYLQQQGMDVLATSLTDFSLKIAHEEGYIKKYAAVNAEQIPYANSSFDFVLCKEAYHHFPRPAIAFYEMLRVARKGVVLIEPYDGPLRLLDVIKEPMKKLLWGKTQTIHFEPSGNYIYRINPKQIGKKLAAVGCSAIAYKKFNDIYLPKCGADSAGRGRGYWLTLLAIRLQDILCTLRLLNPGLVVVVAFREKPTEAVGNALHGLGYSISVLPVNPYVQDSDYDTRLPPPHDEESA